MHRKRRSVEPIETFCCGVCGKVEFIDPEKSESFSFFKFNCNY